MKQFSSIERLSLSNDSDDDTAFVRCCILGSNAGSSGNKNKQKWLHMEILSTPDCTIGNECILITALKSEEEFLLFFKWQWILNWYVPNDSIFH